MSQTKQIVQTLSGKLTAEYGRGFSRTNLFYMIRFVEVFSDLKIVQTLTGQLGWSHFVQIIALDDPLKRDFYAEMCRIIHSNAYSRYIDKTQVFFLVDNDHITHRVLHVQLVSKIARAIGRAHIE